MKVLLVSTIKYFHSFGEYTIDHFPYDHQSTTGKHTSFSLASIKRNLTKIGALKRQLAENTYDAVLIETMAGSMGGVFTRRLTKGLYNNYLLKSFVKAIKSTGIPCAALDIHDDSIGIHPVNQPLLDHCDLYFKRELSVDKWQSAYTVSGALARRSQLVARRDRHKDYDKLRPISLGLGASERQALELYQKNKITQKTTNLFYAQEDFKRPLRTNVMEELSALDRASHRIMLLDKKISFPDYCKELASSLTCLSPPGLGYDCYRHYEAALFGAVPLMCRPYIYQDQGFIHGQSCIYYDPQLPLWDQIKHWYKDPVKLQVMGEAAREHVLRCHTSEARLIRILGELESSGS